MQQAYERIKAIRARMEAKAYMRHELLPAWMENTRNYLGWLEKQDMLRISAIRAASYRKGKD